MTIGTAIPAPAQLLQVKHHFIHSHSIHQPFSAGQFADQANALLSDLFKHHQVVVAVGGTGLYLKALTQGLDDIPETYPQIRNKLNAIYKNEGIESISKLIQETDPAYYATLDKNNPARLIRAAEIIYSSGKSPAYFLSKRKKEVPFKVVNIVPTWPRDVLYERINNRVDTMIREGLLEEAERLYPFRGITALNTVGYTELFDFIDEKYSLEEAIEKIKQHSRNYAKRQLTWFRNQGDYHFLPFYEVFQYIVSIS